VLAGGAVNRTVAIPFESVVTSVALSVPAVVLTVNRCPATAVSWSSRTNSCTSDVDRPSRGNASGDAVDVTDKPTDGGGLPFAERPCSSEQPLATTASANRGQERRTRLCMVDRTEVTYGTTWTAWPNVAGAPALGVTVSVTGNNRASPYRLIIVGVVVS